MKKILLIILIAFSFSGCEKDDICDAATSTTPRLVIEFYDFANPSVLKSVVNLRVTANGLTESLTFNDGFPTTNPERYLFDGSKVFIPLKTTDDVTKYSFVLNSGATIGENTDLFEINYTRQEIYVSRACGFKTVFSLNSTNPIIYSDATTLDGLWIKDLDIVKTNLNNENETHVKIYF
ncbi:DUF6452 family protein [Flavobacterium sp.]|jgi:hypothetical protein|uniref:DUF6452 family protein n=1 Tax=Flavobacterium sp. TaxID=239 RepID=UPI0037517F6A